MLMPHFCEALHSLGLLDRFEEGVREEGEKVQTVKKGAAEGEYKEEPEDISQNQNPDKGTKNDGAVYLVSELSATYLLESSPFSQQHYLAERFRNVERWARLPQIMKQGPDIVEKGPFFLGRSFTVWLKTHAAACFRKRSGLSGKMLILQMSRSFSTSGEVTGSMQSLFQS
ncbi:hypothetical protein [Methanosarcina horonobensis]|uniref:hypothetical protein n=1 Tax=Methanosarcina horonobensis TaxID=418008 RepID=UPI000B13C44D|nr:hypothetical protein [Methanosarcina horonobensis]